MKYNLVIKTAQKLALASVAGLMVACSSSSDSGVSATMLDGHVVAAPVNGASVIVKDASGVNTLAGPVTTGSDGSYSIDPGSASSGTYILESTGGTYTDEATGNQNVSAGTLSAYVDGANLAEGSQVQITAASTIVHNMVVTHGMTLSAALTAFEDTFGFAADSAVAPADATNPAADATNEELLAGLRMAAFSQLTMDLGLMAAEQFDLLAALAADLAFGGLDGEDAGGTVAVTAQINLPIDILNRFSQALVAFHESANNLTGLTNDMIGVVPFAQVALSNSYKVEYLEGMMPAMEGKTMFKLRISDKDTGAPISENVTLMLMMYMSAHKHSTPDLDCTQTATAGDYDCTVYYLMPSVMATGMSMGYWELKAMAGMGESVTLYPLVKMAMGDTPKVVLKGQADTIMNMDGEETNRNWILFNESLSGMGDTREFTMFIAAMESMMSYPAVSIGTILNEGSSSELTVTSMEVMVSTDETNWVAATENPLGSGKWSATPVAGLVDETEGKIYVKLTVNGEQKTTDGAVPAGDGSNDYNFYTVTPGGM